MSKYTTTIKNLIDNGFDFGLDHYPIFDENYRKTLNNNILYHYYENEIGLETPELFKFYLNQKLNEIMPYYNILYEKQRKLIDKLELNVDLTESLEGTNTKEDTNNITNTTETSTSSNSSSNSTGLNNNKNLYLDTPQGNTYKGTIDDTDYATNVTFDKNQSSNTINDKSDNVGNSTNNTTNLLNSNSTNNYIKHIIGNNGNKYNIDILNDIKNNLMNIDLLIISELNDLFMGIF